MEQIKKNIDRIGSARFVMIVFLLFLVLMVFVKRLDAAYLFSNALLHIGMSSFYRVGSADVQTGNSQRQRCLGEFSAAPREPTSRAS